MPSDEGREACRPPFHPIQGCAPAEYGHMAGALIWRMSSLLVRESPQPAWDVVANARHRLISLSWNGRE